MIALFRHLIAIALLPFTVTILIPLWIVQRNAIHWSVPITTTQIVVVAAGACALVVGLALFTSSLARFARDGEGTLAPWDPPRRLVASGPYRFVRNPMISGVCFVLLGESALLRAMPLLQWAAFVFIVNAIYIPLIEEPMLSARFGDAYDEYQRHVPRLVPRLTPWKA